MLMPQTRRYILCNDAAILFSQIKIANLAVKIATNDALALDVFGIFKAQCQGAKIKNSLGSGTLTQMPRAWRVSFLIYTRPPDPRSELRPTLAAMVSEDASSLSTGA